MINKTLDMINKILYVVRKIIKITVCIVLVIILTPIFLYYSYFSLQIAFTSHSPLRRSEAQIQAWLLKEVPVGSSRADVRAFYIEIRNRWWRGRGPFQNQGFATLAPDTLYLGSQITFGFRFFPFPIAIYENVSATWIFDEDGALVDVIVRKG